MTEDFVVVILAIFPVLYLSNFAHEAGHALMGRLSGMIVAAFGMGLGRPVWVIDWHGTRVYFALPRPFQGLTWFVFSQIYPSRRASITAFSGGALANLCIAVVTGTLFFLSPWGKAILGTIAVINFIGVLNLIPFSVRLGKIRMRSDGAQIVETFWGGRTAMPTPVFLQKVRSLDVFLEAIGDARTRKAYALSASLSWLGLGDVEQADAFCSKAEAIRPEYDSSFFLGFNLAVRGFVACETGKLDVSAAAFDAAEAAFTELHNEGGLFLVSLGRTELAMQVGDVEAAVVGINALQLGSFVASRAPLRALLFLTLLRFRLAHGPADEVERLRSQYERSCRYSTTESNLAFFRILAGFYQRQGDLPRADSAYRAALRAARELYLQFTDSDDQARFRRCQETLLNEAADCLVKLGRPEEAEQIQSFLPRPEDWAERRKIVVAKRQRRNRSWLRAGHCLALLNFLGAVGIAAGLGFSVKILDRRLELVFLFACLLLFSAFLAEGIHVLLYLAGRLFPGIQTNGPLLVYFTMIPWMLLALVLLILVMLLAGLR